MPAIKDPDYGPVLTTQAIHVGKLARRIGCVRNIQFDKQLRTGTYDDSADFHSAPISFTEFCNARIEGVMIGGSPLHQYRFHCLRPSKQLHYPFHGTHPVFHACFPHIPPFGRLTHW